MRFRQRGKLSLHRRKHKGYKMKEYTLIKQQGDGSEEVSETETLGNKSHQNINYSINEHSDANEETIKSGKSIRKSKPRKKSKARNTDDDTDSEFELPSYSTKDKVIKDNRRCLRKRKASNVYVTNVENSNSEDVPLDFSEDVSEKKVGNEEHTDNHKRNFLSAPTKNKFRKYSNDSTLDGSQCGRRNRTQVSKGNSGFSKKNHHKVKHGSNFESLVKAFKIYQNLSVGSLNHQDEEQEKCEERKISNSQIPERSVSNEKESRSLNDLGHLLPSNVLYSLQNGSDVNNYFNQLKDYMRQC